MKFDYKKYLYATILIVLLIIFLSLLVNTLYYYDVISNNLVKYFKMIIAVISFFLGGIYIGLNSPNKGYLYGLKESLIAIIILITCGIIFDNIKLSNIIYYLITTICITFGSMIGINKKRN